MGVLFRHLMHPNGIVDDFFFTTFEILCIFVHISLLEFESISDKFFFRNCVIGKRHQIPTAKLFGIFVPFQNGGGTSPFGHRTNELWGSPFGRGGVCGKKTLA